MGHTRHLKTSGQGHLQVARVQIRDQRRGSGIGRKGGHAAHVGQFAARIGLQLGGAGVGHGRAVKALHVSKRGRGDGGRVARVAACRVHGDEGGSRQRGASGVLDPERSPQVTHPARLIGQRARRQGRIQQLADGSGLWLQPLDCLHADGGGGGVGPGHAQFIGAEVGGRGAARLIGAGLAGGWIGRSLCARLTTGGQGQQSGKNKAFGGH